MDTIDSHVIVAADGGGTGCRACAGTLSEGMLAQASGGPGNVHCDFDTALINLTGTIAKALQQAGLGNTPMDQITAHLGVAGAHSQSEMDMVASALPYGRVTVSGDRATSLRGALGPKNGYVVALGTGTIIARQENLQMQTIGGWGFHLSDQASGAWLGRRLLQEIILAEDGLRPHSSLSRSVLGSLGDLVTIVHFASTASPGEFATLAPDVIKAAAQEDVLGRDLMAEGADYIARSLAVLKYTPGDALVLTGGVGPHYANYSPKQLVQNIKAPKGTALDGAFAMALQLAQWTA